MTSPGGGDFNIGRAHGEISITADTRGAQEAQAAMAATSAEAEVLDRRMDIVNKRFDENRRTSVQTAEQIMKQRQQLEDLRVTHERYATEYAKATERLTRAQREFNEEFNKEEPNQRKLLELGKEQERAKEQEERLLLRVTDAHTRYERKLNDVNTALSAFNRHHIEATTGLRRMSLEADRLGESLEKVSDKLGSVLRIVGQGGLMGLFGLGSAGTMAAMGAGGLGEVTSALSGMVIAMQQLSGIVALIPAGVGGAAISLGTLATAFHGVKEAMGSMNDPQKFIESLRELAPAARMAMLTFYSFQDAIRGVRFAIQEATFEPFVRQLQPLIYTWLPLLQNAGVQVGRAFGGMISQIMSFMQTTSAQQGFTTFVNNMVSGLQAASHAIEPLMNAFQTLSVVGSGFFERIGIAITKVANEFNSWVQAAAQSGRLQAWIDSALRAFTDLGHIVMNVGEAIMNIASIGSTHGGGFLAWLSDVTSRIRAWTESADGMQKMATFFDLLHQAGQAMTPILHLMGQALATVAGAFTRLGIEIAPAVTQFFQSIVESLHTLAPILLQMGPSISAFLVQFGQALAQLVQQVGPQLPGFLDAFTKALILLLPVVTTVLREVVNFVSHFTPKEIEGIILAAVAIRGLSSGFSLLAGVLSVGPWGIAAAAIAGIGIAAYEAYQHWEPFKNAVDGVWHMLDSMVKWVAQEFTETGALAPLANMASKAYDWGKDLIQHFIHGMGSVLDDVGKAANDIGDAIDKHLHPGSPTKEGPLSQDGGTENWGAKAVEGYARGMTGATPAVASASAGVGGSAAGGLRGGGGTGTTGMGFSSAGGIGASGSGTSFGSDIGVGRGIGASGFDKYVDFLTKDLSTWSGILQGGFNLIKDTITNVAIPGIKLFADFWQGGNNPLTQPGGIFGPQVPWGQQQVPGIQNVPTPGQAPDDWARKLAANQQTPGQQTPPGVTPIGPRGMPRVGPGVNNPPPANNAPSNNQPTPGPGSAGGGVAPAGGSSGPGGYTADQLAQSIITQGRAAGMNDEQIQATLAVGLQETGLGTNPRTNVVQNQNGTPGITGPFQQDSGYAKYGNRQDPDVAARGFIDQYVHTGQGLNNPNPWDQALQVQRPARVGQGGYDDRGGPNSGSYLRQQQGGAAASILQRLGGQPGTGAPARGLDWFAQELQRRRDAAQHAPAGTQGAQGGPVPGAAVNPATRANIPLSGTTTNAWQQAGSPSPPLYPPGSDTGGYGGPGQNVLPDWVKKFADRFGLVASTYPEGGTLHQAGYAFDFVPKPGNQDPAGSMDAFATFIKTNLTPQTLELIHFNEHTGEKWGIAGGKNVEGKGYYESPNAYGEHGDYGQGAHVHWATDVPPILPGINAPAPEATPGTTAPGVGGGGLSGQATAGTGYGFGGIGALATGGAIGTAALTYGALRVGRGLLGRGGTGGRGVGGTLTQIRGLQALLAEGADPADVQMLQNLIAEGRGGAADALDLFRQIQTDIAGAQTNPLAALQRNLGGTQLAPPGGAPTGGNVFGGPRYGIGLQGGPGNLNQFGQAITNLPDEFRAPGGWRPYVGGQFVDPTTTGGRLPINPPASTTGADPASVVGDVGAEATGGSGISRALGIGGRILGPALAAAGVAPYAWSVAQNLAQNQRVQGRATWGDLLSGRMSVGDINTGTTTHPMGPGDVVRPGPAPTPYDTTRIPQSTIDLAARAGSPIPGTTPSWQSGGPAQPPVAPNVPSGTPSQQNLRRIQSQVSGQTERERLDSQLQPLYPTQAGASRFAGQGGRSDIPGLGTVTSAQGQAPVKVDVTHQAGVPLQAPTPSQQQGPQVALSDKSTPTGPQAPVYGPPSRTFAGASGGTSGVPPTNPPAQTQGQDVVGQPQGPIDYKNVYSADNLPKPLPFNAQTPGDAFMSGLSSAGNIASDAFQVFNDVIKNISDTAAIADMLVRGPSNTEDIVGIIKHFQSFLTTAADISKMVGDVGGMAGGASGGMDMGIGGGIQAVAGMISAGIQAVNQSITLGIDIYHEVGKYAGFIIGEFLGGDATGPLGGNVRMLLNTRTNQLQTYSEDNPLNKNTFNVPLWQRSYQTQPTPTAVQIQQNLYVGPGQTPQQNMSDQMWAATTGGGAVSVAGHS